MGWNFSLLFCFLLRSFHLFIYLFIYIHLWLSRVISVISVVLRETTLTFLTFSVSTGELVSMESEILRVVSVSSTEISEKTRLKILSSGYGYLNYMHLFANRSTFPHPLHYSDRVCFLTLNHTMMAFDSQEKHFETLWEKEKMLVTRNFF